MEPGFDTQQLDWQAREYQRLGEYDRSIPLWDLLCATFPASDEYPLALALDLSSAGRKSEAEEVLGRAACIHPGSFWILFHWALSALFDHRIDIAQQRAQALLSRFKGERMSLELMGDIAVRQRDMATAEHHYEAALACEPENETCVKKLSRARFYRRVSDGFPIPSVRLNDFHSQADYAVLVINLDHSPERLAATVGAFAGSPVPIYRIPGIRGSYLPSTACCRLTGAHRSAKGTLGTFLAHVAAWEVAVVADADYCLVVEDDSSPVIHLPSRVSALGIPDDFDLCFVNERMEGVIASYDRLAPHFQARRPLESLSEWPKEQNAPGGDGYLLSRRGARKLLEFVERDGFQGDVDWRLVGYGVPRGAYITLPEGAPFGVLREIDEQLVERLDAYTLLPCLITAHGQESLRSIENVAGKTAVVNRAVHQ